MVKKILKSILPEAIKQKNNYFDGYALKSYSQEGEDMILRRLFEKQPDGFYVDVGAHHPKRFSNTYFFYKQGWRGINIDAMPGSMRLFNKFRSEDINLEIAISSSRKTLKYYIFNEPALNTFDEKLALERHGKNNYSIMHTIAKETYTLKEILDKYVPPNRIIDFLSIDVEGIDFEVLKSNDFSKYRPKVILIEILCSNLEDIQNNEIYTFLKRNGYLLFAKTFNTVFFISREFFERFINNQSEKTFE